MLGRLAFGGTAGAPQELCPDACVALGRKQSEELDSCPCAKGETCSSQPEECRWVRLAEGE